jgi:HK97 family phage major capsid protein
VLRNAIGSWRVVSSFVMIIWVVVNTLPFVLSMLAGPREQSSSSQPNGKTPSARPTIIVGDFRTGYTIVDRIAMTMEIVQHLVGRLTASQQAQRGAYAFWRTGANVVAPNAFRYLGVT